MPKIPDKSAIHDSAEPSTKSLGEPLPTEARSSRGDLHEVYERLRQDILDGTIQPGEILNQVHIAKLFNVSRTPVREALRLLQAEGLVETHFQHRIRVTSITPQEIDSVYAMWILLDGLAVALTVPRLKPAELEQIKAALHAMNSCSPSTPENRDNWASRHIVFHQLLIMHAGLNLANAIANCRTSSERARRTFMGTEPYSWLASEAEHNALVQAYEAGSVEQAIYIYSRQLSRIALTVMGNIDPSYEPVAIRQALKLVDRPGGANIELLGQIATPQAKLAKPRRKKSA